MSEDIETTCASCGKDDASLKCEECGKSLCRDCAVEVAGRQVCYRCKREYLIELERGEEKRPSRHFKAKGIRPHTIFLATLLVFIILFSAVYPAMVIVVMILYFIMVFFGSVAVLLTSRIKKVFFVNEVWIDSDSLYGMTTSLTIVRLRWKDVLEGRIQDGRIALEGDRTVVVKGRFTDFNEMEKLVRKIAAEKNIKITEEISLNAETR